MPRLDYVSQTPQSVSVTYSEMPPGTQVLFVNSMSGVQTASPDNALSGGGAGATDIPFVSGLGKGEYYLLAQDNAQKYLAQTVAFYIN